MYVFGRHAVLFVSKHHQRVLQTTSHLGAISHPPRWEPAVGWPHGATQQNRFGEESKRVSGTDGNCVGGLEEQKVCASPDTWCQGTVPLCCVKWPWAPPRQQPRAWHRHVGHGVASQRCSREREEVPTISKVRFAEMFYISLVIFLSRLITPNLTKMSSPLSLSLWSSLSPQPLFPHHLPSSADARATAFSLLEMKTMSMCSGWIK